MRSGASVSQLRHERAVPRGARSGGRVFTESFMALPRLAVRRELVAGTGMIEVGDAGDASAGEGAAQDQQARLVPVKLEEPANTPLRDRKSTRLNSSHSSISYAVFC